MKQYIDQLEKIYEKNLPALKNLNQYLYENPELGNCEYKAAEAHKNLLSLLGFDITDSYCGIETAYLASYASSNSDVGAKIAYLTEYDALPGIGHGCGHNILGTAGIAAAALLKNFVDSFGGKVLVIGCPAEETNGAKVDMSKMGVFDNLDAAIIVHPTGEYHFRSGTSQAMEALQFTFKGKTSHAAGAPFDGINALDGVLNLFSGINALRQQTHPSARIHGIISEGGRAANIIPDLAIANFYVRAPKSSQLKELVEKVKNCAKGAALASGTELEISNYEYGFADLITNKTLSSIYENNLNLLGVTEIKTKEGMGSTDAGNVSYCCPTIHPSFPISKEKLIGHSVEFAQASVSDTAYEGMREAVLAMALTGIQLLTQEDTLQKIKEEFQQFNN